jgi:hypothetical protein
VSLLPDTLHCITPQVVALRSSQLKAEQAIADAAAAKDISGF